MTEDELRALAEQLVDARHRADALRDTLAEFREEEEPQRVLRELQRLEGLLREQQAEADALTRDLRTAAVDYTKETGVTDPLGKGAVVTKTFSTAEYGIKDAMEWCWANARHALSLDHKEFQRIAKQRGLDWVKWSMEPHGFVANDLAAKLNDPGMSRADVEREVQRAQHTGLREVMENER